MMFRAIIVLCERIVKERIYFMTILSKCLFYPEKKNIYICTVHFIDRYNTLANDEKLNSIRDGSTKTGISRSTNTCIQRATCNVQG